LAYFERLENPQTLQNPQRMMRFVEVCIGTGALFLFLNQKQNERGFTPTIIGLEAERSVMYTRINQRVDIMMQHGLLTEAKGLYANKVECPANCWLSRIVQLSQRRFSLFAVEEIKKYKALC
jgi:tRNA dimethylallyltransferase